MIKSLISRQRIGFAALTFIVAASSATGIQASRTATIQGSEYRIDTLSHVKVGPGTMLTKLLYARSDGNKKFRGFFITSDMKGNDLVEYRMEIGNDSILTGETISSCATRKTNEKEQYFAGVNADFYLTWNPYVGVPNMGCYMDGQIAVSDRDESIRYGHFFMDYNKNMWCDFPKQSLTFVKPDGKRIGITRVNYDLFDNELVLMNDKMGKYTHTSGATEVAVRLLEGERWAINKTCRVQVVGTPVAGGNMKIEPGQAVLSAKGNRVADISDLKNGDIITMDLETRLGDYDIVPESLKECSGGDVVILKRGEVVYEADRWINARDGNNPRTMFGYTKDRSKMIWGLIDGRSSISDGCTYLEGADVMAIAGCYDAVNVDGGGSSQMYVKELGIVNVPSDGKERAVSNGMYAVLKAPIDNEIAEIRFVDWAMTFPKYGVYTPKIYGYNKYGILVDTDVKGYKLSCPAELGTVKDGGTTFVGSGDGLHALTATYKGLTATIPVTVVTPTDMKMVHESVINDGYRNYPVEVVSKVNESYMQIDPAAFTWSSDDATTVSIDAQSGVLKGEKDGTTNVRAKLNDFDGVMQVVVEKPTSRAMAADPNLDPTTWKVTQTGGQSGKLETLQDGFRYTYTGKSGRAPYIKLAKTLKLWSMPDTVRLVVSPTNVPIKSVTLAFKSADGIQENVQKTFEAEEDKATVISYPLDEWCDPSNVGSYPIQVDYIYLNMGSSTSGTEYVIDVPVFAGIYGAYKEGSGVEGVATEAGFGVAKTTVTQGEALTLRFSKPGVANVAVYNAAGQKVGAATVNAEAGLAQVQAADLSRGIYFVGITQNGENCVTKVVVR